MKQKIHLFIVILILHLLVINPDGSNILNFELLGTGTYFDPFTENLKFSLYSYLLNTAVAIIFLVTVIKSISKIFELQVYIQTRGKKIQIILIGGALKSISKILFIKQLIYIIFFVYELEFTIFYFFDMISTFLTLAIYSQIFIFLKLQGMKEKIPLFDIILIYMFSQLLSYSNSVFSLFTIAPIEWEHLNVSILGAKLGIGILLFSVNLFTKNKLDRIIGVNYND